MESPRVFLWTKAREYFTSADGFEGTTSVELEVLLKLNEELGRSIQIELENRQVIVEQERSDGVTRCIKKIQENRRSIEILGRLDQKVSGLVETATKIMKTQQTKREPKIYHTFLHDVARQSCRGGALCTASLGKETILSLNSKERIELVHYLSITRAAYESPTFIELVDLYGIPHKGLNEDSSIGRHKRQRSANAEDDESRPRTRVAITDMVNQPIREGEPSSVLQDPEQTFEHETPIVNPAIPLSQTLGALVSTNEHENIVWLQLAGQILPQGRYSAFSVMPLSKMEQLPEPFRKGMMRSDLWRDERTRNPPLDVTSCGTIFLPQVKADCVILLRVGYDPGFEISRLWGLGEVVDVYA